MWEAWLAVKTKVKILLNTSAFSMSEETCSPFSIVRGGSLSFAYLLWPVYLRNSFLLFSTPLIKFNYICTLAILISSLHIQAASPHCSQVTHSTFHILLVLSQILTSRSSLSHLSFLSLLSDFFCWEIESSYAPRKVSLKCCQLYSVLFSQRTVFQGISSSNSLQILEFSLLKFRLLTQSWIVIF